MFIFCLITIVINTRTLFAHGALIFGEEEQEDLFVYDQ